MKLEIGHVFQDLGTVLEIELQDSEIHATVLGYDSEVKKINVTHYFDKEEV